jgi:hypothetical protein
MALWFKETCKEGSDTLMVVDGENFGHIWAWSACWALRRSGKQWRANSHWSGRTMTMAPAEGSTPQWS